MKRFLLPILTIAAILSSCAQEGPATALATRLGTTSVDFPAQDATEIQIKLFSDGAWKVHEAPSWVSISPSEGSGMALISVCAEDNVTGGEVDAPRSGNVIIGGDKLIGQVTLAVNQTGDRYVGAPVSTISALKGATDGDKVCVKSAQAIASTASKILISDGTGYALADASLAIGKTATVKGLKGFDKGLVTINDADLLSIADGTAPSPTPTDITSTLNDFTGNGYVTVSGVAGAASGGDVQLTVTGSSKKVIVIDIPFSLGLASLANHMVIVTGYAFAGTDGVYMVADSAEDKGMGRVVETVAAWEFNVDKMPVYGPTFTGVDTPDASNIYTSANVKEAGDNGWYIDANAGGEARLTYVQVDKTTIDTKDYAKHYIGKTGEPYVSGLWKGDYWLFTVKLSKTYKAGTDIHFAGTTYASNGGLKYWILELKDGENWVPLKEVMSATVASDGDGNTETVEYNVEQLGGTYIPMDATFTMTKEFSTEIQIRMRSVANVTASTAKYKGTPDGGNCRIAGNSHQNPIIEVSYEP